MNNKILSVIVIIVVVLIGVSLYSMSSSTTSTYSTPTVSPESKEVASTSPESSKDNNPAVSSSSVKTFTVTAQNFSFSPTTITVTKGDKVKIVLKNVGGFHDFVIDEFNVRTSRINDEQEATVEFTANKSGTFEYYCSVGTHRQMGMRGTLIVK